VLIGSVARIEQEINRLEARKARLLALLVDDVIAQQARSAPGISDDLPMRSAAAEIAAVSGVAQRTMMARMSESWTLRERFPATLAAMDAALGGFERPIAAIGGGADDGAGHLGADGDGDKAGGDCGGAAGGGAAWRVCGIPGVGGGAGLSINLAANNPTVKANLPPITVAGAGACHRPGAFQTPPLGSTSVGASCGPWGRRRTRG
jgi:hypothetical protein